MLLHQVRECTKLIVEAKDKHLAKLSSKLDNRDTAPKTCWSITNRFLSNKKIPIIPPVLFEDKLISDFEKKVTLPHNPANTPRVFNVESTWKRSFPRRFNVEYT